MTLLEAVNFPPKKWLCVRSRMKLTNKRKEKSSQRDCSTHIQFFSGFFTGNHILPTATLFTIKIQLQRRLLFWIFYSSVKAIFMKDDILKSSRNASMKYFSCIQRYPNTSGIRQEGK